MSETAILIIKDYIFDNIHPSRNWPGYEFRKASYTEWAGKEIIELLKRYPNVSPALVIRKFADKMKNYAEIDHWDKKDALIFETAYELALDVLDVIHSM